MEANDTSAGITTEQLVEMNKVAHSLIILHLSDIVIRQMRSKDTVGKLWSKFQSTYQKALVSNKIFIKTKIFSFKMNSSKRVKDILDEFYRIIPEMKNIGETLTNENHVILLFNSPPDAYNDVKSAMHYGRDELTTRVVLTIVRTNEMKLKENKRTIESLYV